MIKARTAGYNFQILLKHTTRQQSQLFLDKLTSLQSMLETKLDIVLPLT